MGFPRQEYWSGLLFPSQGIFLTQTLNPHLLHCSQMLYCWATRIPFLLFNAIKKIFIYFLLRWVLLAACGIFCCGAWASLWLWPAGFRACGFCSWGMRAYLPRGCGILVTWPEVKPVTRDWTYVPCVGRKFLSIGPPGKPKCYYFLIKNGFFRR